MAEKDSTTGKFVKKFDPARSEEAVAAGVYEDGDGVVVEGSEIEEVPAKKPSLRLQSRFRNHRIMIRPTRRVIHAALGITEAIPGLSVRFEGPQRIFDSEFAQEQYGWSDEERDLVERKLVSMKEFMSDFYPAPMSVLPDHLAQIARVRPPQAKLKCQAFGFLNGELRQCPNEASAGRQWCGEHDPDTTRIVRGGGTTKS